MRRLQGDEDMNILVTGGNGFIGSHLAESLIKRGWQTSTLDIIYTRNTEEFDCKKIKGDIRDYTVVSEAVWDKDVIVHLAAVSRVEWGQKNPRKCIEVNALGTLTLLEAVRKNNPNAVVIFGSSREVYGEPNSLPVVEDSPKAPISVYGASKLASENLISSYHRVHGLNYVILRFSNVYGSPLDLPERVIPKLMRLALEDNPLTVYGRQQVLDFTFIDDVVEGVVNAAIRVMNVDESVINNDFNFASGRGTSVLELAKLIKKICNSNSKILIKDRRKFDVSRFVGDCRKAKRYLGYKPRHSLQAGLRVYGQRMSARA